MGSSTATGRTTLQELAEAVPWESHLISKSGIAHWQTETARDLAHVT